VGTVAPTLVFGFGSLVNSVSRARTLGDVPAWPVRVAGLRRGWYAPSRRIRHTALGVVVDAAAHVNGVLALLPDDSLERLDRREAQYDRTELSWTAIESLGEPPPEGTVVTYVPRSVSEPDADHPIIRSYVDVTLSGCLEYGLDFACEMVTSTHGWSEHHFEDDRDAPRYPHHEAHAPTEVLDALLRTVP
jgi:hypothetical protein